MDHPNSHLIDPSTYDTNLDNLAPNLPLRLSHSAALIDRGAFRAQKDWQHVFGTTTTTTIPSSPSSSPSYVGTAGPEYGFLSVCVPDTLPDRAELVGYIVEMVFLLDDLVEGAESPAAAAAPYLADLLYARDAVERGGDVGVVGVGGALPGGGRVARMFVGVGRAMLAIDPGCARDAFRWLEVSVKAMLARFGGSRELRDLEEYLEYRRVNVASQSMFGLVLFAMGLAIPEDQQQTCLELSEAFWLQFALTNDCHSWERERKAASDSGQPSVTNAVWVLMNKHAMSCEEAKQACRDKASQYAAEYVRVVEAAKARDDLCRDAKRLLEWFRNAISGNIVWGLQCPRYNADRTLTAAQLELADAIQADETLGWIWGQEKKAMRGIAEHPKADTNRNIAKCTATNGAVTTGIVINGDSHQKMEVVQDFPSLGTDVLEEPSRYIDSLPGKGIRHKAIQALNVWYRVPPQQAAIISKAVDLLHGASLMLDDIEDSSCLRRGKPAAHLVFGTMQTINSAGFRFLNALEEVRKLDSQRCMDVFCQELQDLYVGQSHDLSWTCTLSCPTEEEYLAMVDGKTAGLFRMLARMLDAQSSSPTKPDVALITRFMTLLGRFFQIRDDYMNLTSADYTKQKGFCEDLDEGKYSLPIIHALGRSDDSRPSNLMTKANSHVTILQNLLSQRHIAGKMTLDQKHLFLEHLKQTGSLEYTRQAMGTLQLELKSLAREMGMHSNEKLAGLLETLKV
ncbi:isoprenoid synthase domain-containing protein [Chaetomium tenue]|uniref:Isoprenoid synthase domain-containing protein n=1 Tax=Chaetomium tenue TaxID=1854479 RepID=A0ACB7PLH4_9PEZI|nr:isoprenoid synthase domain-containing protein [Chaetomium globosum]